MCVRVTVETMDQFVIGGGAVLRVVARDHLKYICMVLSRGHARNSRLRTDEPHDDGDSARLACV